MPLLTRSDLSDLARYPASLRSAARALWGAELANARSGPAPVVRGIFRAGPGVYQGA